MRKTWMLGLAIAVLAVWRVPVLRSQDANSDSPSGKEFPADKGPDTIDVSGYPKEQQDNYAVFAEKCSKCHTLARPINSQYALPEEWQAYVTKMRKKPRSGIDEDTAKQIIDFLTYDSSVRKKDLIAQKLKEKAADDKAADKVAPKAADDDKSGAAQDDASKN